MQPYHVAANKKKKLMQKHGNDILFLENVGQTPINKLS